MKYIILFLFSVSASATEVLGCGYLTNARGAYYPGLSRPQVVVDGRSAEVTVYIEAGGGMSARRTYVLSAFNGGYIDGEGNTLTWAGRRSVLTLMGLRTVCSR